MAYDRGFSASGNPMCVGLPGGGGCPDTETLVPELPFDFLQPQMRRGVTQAGYGGPFVIRSNPIGAIIDTIRNFCFPQPMQTNDGTSYDSAAGLGSYGTDTSPLLGAEGYGGGGFTPYGYAPTTCGSGYMPDGMGGCAPVTPPSSTSGNTGTPPTPPAVMSDCDYNNLAQAAVTGSSCGIDKACLCACARKASACAQAQNEPQRGGGGWTNLAGYFNRVAGVNCNTYMAPPPKMGSGKGPLSGPAQAAANAGLLPIGTPGSPPTGYVPSPQSGGSTNNPFPGVGTGNVTNPPPNMPPQIGAAQNAARRLSARVMPPMPQMPNPMSLTEGNVGLQPSREPLRGSFDPRRIYSRYYGAVAGRGRQIR